MVACAEGGVAETAPQAAVGIAVRLRGDALLVGFRVSPSSSKTAARGLYGDRVKVSLAAPPEDGKANAELCSALARWLGLPADTVHLHAGHTSRDKVVAFTHLDETTLRRKLAVLIEGGKGSGRR